MRIAFLPLALSLVALFAVGRPMLAAEPAPRDGRPAAADEKKPAKPHVLVTISKETTYIIGPLRKEPHRGRGSVGLSDRLRR